MKAKVLFSAMLLFSTTAFCTIFTITNSGFTFSPASKTINLGDGIKFELPIMHNAVEVSQSTWDSNGTTPLTNGFQTDFGGGTVLPEKLSVGTHYYICGAHIGSGMKGIIIVQTTTGIKIDLSEISMTAYPNPSAGKFRLITGSIWSERGIGVEIYNLQGKQVFQTLLKSNETEIDLTNQNDGIYFAKIQEGQNFSILKFVIRK